MPRVSAPAVIVTDEGARLIVSPFWVHIIEPDGTERYEATPLQQALAASNLKEYLMSRFTPRPSTSRQALPRNLRLSLGLLAVVVVLASLLLANWVTTYYGFIPVGFGFEATAGTLFAGVMLAGRDAVQDTLGRWAVIVLILVGTLLSFLIAAPFIALASAAAFLFAEGLDFAVYSPLRARAKFGDRRWALAVVASNVVGAIADTVIFLTIAFGFSSVGPAFFGQLVGKTWATIAYLILGVVAAVLWRRYRQQRATEPAESTSAIQEKS